MLSYTTGERFQVKFAEEKSTDFGGLFLIEKMLDSTGFGEIFDSFFGGRMLSEYSSFSYKDLFRLEISKSLIDHRATTDVDFLKEDTFFTEMFDHLPGKSTLNNFQNTFGREGCAKIREVMMRWLQGFPQLLYSENGYITIDIDATDIPTYGEQEGARGNKYYGNRVYLPLIVNIFNGLLPFIGKLREGNSYTTNGAVEMMQEANVYVEGFDGYDANKVLRRGDAGFQSEDIFAEAEGKGQKFLCRIKQNEIVMEIVRALVKETVFDEDKRYRFVFNYQAKSRSKARVVVAEYVPAIEVGGLFPEYRFFCTNVFGEEACYYEQKDGERVMNLYHERGTAEHPFHDFKESFQTGYTNAQDFYVNEFKFLVSLASMQIYVVFRELYLKGTELGRSYFSTISRWIVFVGAKFVRTGRRVIMKLKEGTKKAMMRKQVLIAMNIART